MFGSNTQSHREPTPNPNPTMSSTLSTTMTTTLSDADERTILWVYSIDGDVGKSYLKDHLMGTFNALVVDGTRVRDVKHAILKKIEDDDEFLDNPIVVLDIPRQLSTVVNSSSFYVSLEEIQRNFHSGKYKGGQVVWTVPPKVIVFANCPPATDKLSSDRLKTYLINSDNLDMQRDVIIDAKLAAQSIEFKRLQNERQIAIANAPEIDLTDTQTCFEMCFTLAIK